MTDFLAEALGGPRPCDDCPHYERCARQQLSCTAFSWFVYGGLRWRGAARKPTRAAYVRLFSTDDSHRGAASGLRRETIERIERLRTLSGAFRSTGAALNSVGLTSSYWQLIAARHADIAAHVRSLVVEAARR